MSSLVERNFTLVLRIANAIVQGRADAGVCAIALAAQHLRGPGLVLRSGRR